eukprot:TRINITY_DN21354_c0_g1_i1.p1 TRINITY_DN21354_c0_g1~~TRINITY_DN21354_c0_g1_i1.p1  ORF type:complete len:340 (-),score=91.56 TRINITY_DN21354_c0_g1_i1:157-1176(-)
MNSNLATCLRCWFKHSVVGTKRVDVICTEGAKMAEKSALAALGVKEAPKDTGPKYTSEAEDLMKSLADTLKKKRMRASDLFKKIDASGDGNVTGEELRAGLSELGFKMSDTDLASVMSVIDKDGGGEVSVKEFDRAVRAAEKLPSKKAKEAQAAAKKKQGITEDDREEFRQIFCLFKQLSQARMEGASDEKVGLIEWDDTGSITVDDLEQLLETVGLKLSPSQMEAMLKEIDTDGNGEIDFQEFCSTMTKKIQIDYDPEDVAKAFKAFSRNAPEGMIRVHDLRNALKTYMHKELVDSEVEELLLHYKDCFVTIPGSDQEYFNYQDYIDLMSPLDARHSE